jgi:protein SCO1/2
MQRREFLRLVGLSAVGELGLFMSLATAHREDAQVTQPAGRQVIQQPAPTFALTDQDGSLFSSLSWHGRAVLVTFGYTACPDICPLLTANLALIQQELPEAARPHTGMLFITTDPKHDTPAALRAYGAGLRADFSSWKFLTGKAEDLRRVWQGFGVVVQELASGQVDHTMLTTIIDRQGLRRINYYGTRWHPDTVRGNLVALARNDMSGL